MPPQPLARVVDPTVLAQCDGPQGRLRLTVPSHWLASGGRLRLEVPRRVSCARCDGGGCDGCARSGALRCPEPAARRSVELDLPVRAGSTAVCVRLSDPFGDGTLAQLLVELCPGEAPSPFVRRLAAAPAPLAPPRTAVALLLVLLAVLALALLAWLAR